ncbi:hypothetical protein RB595_002319 [Gaeumannomyces hyphopodioides]
MMASSTMSHKCGITKASLEAAGPAALEAAAPPIISSTDLRDFRDKFFLWSGTMGAMHQPSSNPSLECRLSDAQGVLAHIHRLLDDFQDALEEVMSLFSPQPPGSIRASTTSARDIGPSGREDEEPEYPESLADETSDTLRSLFRAGILVRKATSRDRFAHALKHSTSAFLDHEKAWKIHAFTDIRPYVCTLGGPECEDLMFPDRNSWFRHELTQHRSQFTCAECTAEFGSELKFRDHLAKHGESSDERMDDLAAAGRRAQRTFVAGDCPLCDEWEAAKAATSSQVVTGPQLKRHVATHLEQLALFAVPRAVAGDEEEQEEFREDPEAKCEVATDKDKDRDYNHFRKLMAAAPQNRALMAAAQKNRALMAAEQNRALVAAAEQNRALMAAVEQNRALMAAVEQNRALVAAARQNRALVPAAERKTAPMAPLEQIRARIAAIEQTEALMAAVEQNRALVAAAEQQGALS